MNTLSISEESRPFLQYLETWTGQLPRLPLSQAAPYPERAAIISVDVINGFCYEGPLASPRVAGIVQPIVRLFEQAWEYGIHQVVLTQDTHEPEAVEFGSWPAHCIRGTSESETVPEFKQLPFFSEFRVFPKNSIHSALNTELGDWIKEHAEIDTYFVVGDCTDLCTYQLAMYLRLDANSRQIQRRVIVPADCVDTYDLPLEAAQKIGAMPHPARLIHPMFLYHMVLNGVEVVDRIE